MPLIQKPQRCVRLRESILVGGRAYDRGAEVDLPAAKAQELLSAGLAVPVPKAQVLELRSEPAAPRKRARRSKSA